MIRTSKRAWEHFVSPCSLFSTAAVKLDFVHQKLYPQPMATVSGKATGSMAPSAMADKWILADFVSQGMKWSGIVALGKTEFS